MKLHDEFMGMLMKEFGEEKTQEICDAYQQQSAIRGIKINTYKPVEIPFATRNSILNEDILIPLDYKQAVVHPFHHAGCYYIQDPSATLPVKALHLSKYDCVLDLCAAPGGKATQILNTISAGFLIANEIDTGRVAKLIGNIERWGVENVVVVNHDGRDIPKYFKNSFTKVVLDAPCSGEGLYRKMPEHAMQFNMKTIMALKDLQIELLEAAYQSACHDADIVYATCTLNPYENEEVVAAFLKTHPRCFLVDHGLKNAEPGLRGFGHKVARFFPSKEGEGHFIAKIRVIKEEKRHELVFEAYKKTHREIHGIPFQGHMFTKKDKVNILNRRGPLITKAKVVHDGICIGVEKKGRLDFDQALAYAVDMKGIIETLDLDLESAFKYLFGLTLEQANQGYRVVSYNHQALGFIKGQNNKYPKHLRNRFERYQ